jgi:hypothetical protein
MSVSRKLDQKGNVLMFSESFWSAFAYFYFVLHTICLIEVVDVVLFGKPQITFFLLVFAGCYYLNREIYNLYLYLKKIDWR